MSLGRDCMGGPLGGPGSGGPACVCLMCCPGAVPGALSCDAGGVRWASLLPRWRHPDRCNPHPPLVPCRYVHRVGRTARLGQRGDAVLFLLPRWVRASCAARALHAWRCSRRQMAAACTLQRAAAPAGFRGHRSRLPLRLVNGPLWLAALHPLVHCSERGYVQHLAAHGVSLREQPAVPLLNHVLGADRKVRCWLCERQMTALVHGWHRGCRTDAVCATCAGMAVQALGPAARLLPAGAHPPAPTAQTTAETAPCLPHPAGGQGPAPGAAPRRLRPAEAADGGGGS